MQTIARRCTPVVASALACKVPRVCFSQSKSYRLMSDTIYLSLKKVDEQKSFNQVAILAVFVGVGLYFSPYKNLLPVACALVPISLGLGLLTRSVRRKLVRKIQYQPKHQTLTFSTFDESIVIKAPLSSVRFSGFLGFDEKCSVQANIEDQGHILAIQVSSYIKTSEVQISNRDFVESLFTNDVEEVKRYH